MKRALIALAVYTAIVSAIGGGLAGMAIDVIERHERVNIKELHERIEKSGE